MPDKVDLIFKVVEYTYTRFSQCSDKTVQQAYLQIAAYLIDQTIVSSLSAANMLQQHILKGKGQWESLKLVKDHVVMASKDNRSFNTPSTSLKRVTAEEALMYKRVFKLLNGEIGPEHADLTLKNIYEVIYLN